MSELNERVLEAVVESGLGDSDQRSALGMARSWIDKHKPLKRSIIPGYEKRDELAESLVMILEECSADATEQIAALTAAREAIDRPFLNPTMLGSKHQEIERPSGGMMGKSKRQPAEEQK